MHLIAHNRFSSAFRFILAHLKASGYATDSTKRQAPGSQVSQSSQTQTSQPSRPQVLLAAWNLRFNNSNDSLSLCIRGTDGSPDAQSALRFSRTPALAYTPASASRQGQRASPKGSPALPCAGSEPHLNPGHLHDFEKIFKHEKLGIGII